MTFVMDQSRYAIQECRLSHGALLRSSQETSLATALYMKRTLANLEKAWIVVLQRGLTILSVEGHTLLHLPLLFGWHHRPKRHPIDHHNLTSFCT